MVRIYDTAFQKIRISIAFQLVYRKIGTVQSGHISNCIHIPTSLEFHIMNSVYRSHIAIELILPELSFQKYRNQTCLPIMTMNNIRLESDFRQNCQDSFGKISKFLRILINLPVRCRSRKIILIVNEIKCDTIFFPFINTCILGTPV